jgi:AcrR family transcriptional regulator
VQPTAAQSRLSLDTATFKVHQGPPRVLPTAPRYAIFVAKTSARFLFRGERLGHTTESSPTLLPKISAAHEQQRRDQILGAAMACFARQGYHATSMDDVVRESGLSVGAIYTYFPSKEDLFLALCDARSEQTLAYMNDLFRRPGPMPDKSREAIDFFFQHLTDDFVPLARMGVEFLSEAAKSERIKERQQRRFNTVRQFYCWLLREAQERGGVRADVDVEAAAELMMALNEGILVLSVAGLRQVQLDTLKAAYIDFLNGGLGSPTGSLFTATAAVGANGVAPRDGTHDKGDLQP